MSDAKTAVMFPGQGAFHGPLLKQAVEQYAPVSHLMSVVDEVALEVFGRKLTEVVLDARITGIAELLADDLWVSQLAIFASDVAAFTVLERRGLRPDALVGHSLGEIPALVAGGALTVRDGAWITAQRVLAIEALGAVDGSMTAVGVGSHRAAVMTELIADPMLAVAVRNRDDQTVLSGPSAAVATAEEIARALRVSAVRIPAPFPFHSPLLQPAVPGFLGRIRDIRPKPLTTPVYSPIEGRFYRSEDDLLDLLAGHLVKPVGFVEALRALHRDGFRIFVESGALDTLTRLSAQVLPEVRAFATLAPRADGSRALDATLVELCAAGLIQESHPDGAAGLAGMLLPGSDADAFARFWSLRGDDVLDAVRRQFLEFTGAESTEAQDETERPPVDRESLIAELGEMFADAMDYPAEVFGPDVLLEAELGIDSIKQVELLTRIADRYLVLKEVASFKQELDTLGKIADLVLAESAVLAGASL